MTARILRGDCLEVLASLPESSIDALVTDPPAGISFMGKDWDGDRGGRANWIAWLTDVMKECFRVLKPGAHGLVWALPRTAHWTATACEDAGFEVRDCVTHLFGTGFPKSLDVSKAIDKSHGLLHHRKDLGPHPSVRGKGSMGACRRDLTGKNRAPRLTSAASAAWEGWGTALKPAAEFWWLVRKPISERTVAANVLKWGTGGLNIDGCRIGSETLKNKTMKSGTGDTYGKFAEWDGSYREVTGRFPSHLVLDDVAAKALDEQSGLLAGPGNRRTRTEHSASESKFGMGGGAPTVIHDRGGGASRFFYVAKASSREKNAGLEGMKKGEPPRTARTAPAPGRKSALGAPRENYHPTVKPIALMRYLCRLVTPPGGTVLDPFTGSGTTGIAARREGFAFVGVEQSKEYIEIAKRRIKAG